MIGNSQDYSLAGFFNIKLLCSCKKVNAKGSEVLYGSNTFVFDTEGVNSVMHLDNARDQVPGLLDEFGNPPTKDQTPALINQLFDRQMQHSRFLWFDRLIHCLNRIGPVNAKLLRSIKINGAFGVNTPSYALTLCDLLPIYTNVLAGACNIRKIILELPEEKEEKLHALNIDPDEDVQERIDTRIDNTIMTLVEGLPNVQQLQLGDYEIPRDGEGIPIYDAPNKKPKVDEWVPFRRWETIMEERTEAGQREGPVREQPVTEHDHSSQDENTNDDLELREHAAGETDGIGDTCVSSEV